MHYDKEVNLLDLLFPRRCVGCGKFSSYFCADCTKTIKRSILLCPVCEKPAIDGITHPRCHTRYSLDGLISFFKYEGIIRQAIKTLKYRFVTDLSEEFVELIPAELFSQLTMQQLNNETILIPIPLHPSRLRFRGFNQAEVLGKLLANRLNIPIRIDILKRVKKTIPQVEVKDRKKRLANMEGVFTFNNLTIQQLNNNSILLFDDVFTTGATLRSAANVLKRTGAKTVWGITLAHG